jgi:Cu(I)/Ag(I) efflux system membrane fusion protein
MGKISLLLAPLCAALLGSPGCETSSAPPSTAPATQAADTAAAGEGSREPAQSQAVAAELAKLSPDDRAAAEKQRLCVVSGELLGSMGAPLKVDVDGRHVWICCEGCQEPLLESPAEYLAKLPTP